MTWSIVCWLQKMKWLSWFFAAENILKSLIVVNAAFLKNHITSCSQAFTEKCELSLGLQNILEQCNNQFCVLKSMKDCLWYKFQIWMASSNPSLIFVMLVPWRRSHASGSHSDRQSHTAQRQTNLNWRNSRQQIGTIIQQNSGKQWDSTDPEYDWAAVSTSGASFCRYQRKEES